MQSHLRLSERQIHSDLIPTGQAGLLIAVEPLEALRHQHHLRADGALVTSLNPFVNIGDYPPAESVLERLAAHPQHVLIDADRIARAAGSGRATNMAVLGAELSPQSEARLAAGLAKYGLERLVNARNPLDVTPMASEEVYEGALRVLLESDEVDAVVVGIVPLTAALKTVRGARNGRLIGRTAAAGIRRQ